MGTLYYGDNLEILRRYIKDETVDLVYLDPPFNSAQNYNAFFQEKDGTAAASQIRGDPAFPGAAPARLLDCQRGWSASITLDVFRAQYLQDTHGVSAGLGRGHVGQGQHGGIGGVD